MDDRLPPLNALRAFEAADLTLHAPGGARIAKIAAFRDWLRAQVDGVARA
jgi:hypothetical protein